MKAEIDSISCEDFTNADFKTWVPPVADFYLPVRLMIKPMGGQGYEVFDVTIMSPSYLAKELESKRESGLFDVVSSRDIHVVDRFTASFIEEYFRDRISWCAWV